MAGAIALSPVAEAASPTFGRPLRYFGDYELIDEIARGGMGVVYKARQISLNRTVAVKMILTGRRPMAVEVNRFRASTRAAAGLQHPNIVPIYEIGEQDGHDYFSMEFVEGPNLAQVVRENPLPAARAANYVRTIAEAVHYAHERGILHRDLKPSNILLDSLDQPRVTDFGLAKNLAADPELTEAGQVLGAPSFIPPEQASGHTEEVGRHSDVYALGGILYYLLTGHPPFAAETPMATLARVLHHDPVAPRNLNASIPRDLENICLKCLEKQPQKRYSTAKNLADELGRFQRHERIQARPTGQGKIVWRWCRRHPIAVPLTATLLLLLGGVASIFWHAQPPQTVKREEAGRPSPAEKSPLQANPSIRSPVGEMHDAAKKGDLETVHPMAKETLAQVNPRIQSSGGEIHQAAQDGDLEKVKALLKDHPDLVFTKDNNGRTALDFASYYGHNDVVELLLANKAEIDARDNNGRTPLHYAAATGHNDTADILLANKAELDVKDEENGDTPLHLAVVAGHKDVVELLLANKADVNVSDNDGDTPLHKAALKGRKELAALLLGNKATATAKTNKGFTPLHVAAYYGQREVAELLLLANSDGNAKAKNGTTPLHLAAQGGYKDLAQLLLANKSDVNAKDNEGQTPLHYAATTSHGDVAELLREHGGHE